MNKNYCEKCKTEREFKYHHGLLGYESFICSVCDWDINERKNEDSDGKKPFAVDLSNEKPASNGLVSPQNREMSISFSYSKADGLNINRVMFLDDERI